MVLREGVFGGRREPPEIFAWEMVLSHPRSRKASPGSAFILSRNKLQEIEFCPLTSNAYVST